jgi:hypothetical protein
MKNNIRWFYMIIGVVAMLFAGVLYAWSILKAPLLTEFGWGPSELALNFTLAMTFFCIGGLLGAQISKKAGHKLAIISAGVLSALGFILTALLNNAGVWMLYITYGVLAGLGIGIAYNVVIATVRDTGCGMGKETQKHIFDKFYQGDTSHSQEGNGLGLALVDRVVKLLDGEIIVTSDSGKGSEFKIVLENS